MKYFTSVDTWSDFPYDFFLDHLPSELCRKNTHTESWEIQLHGMKPCTVLGVWECSLIMEGAVDFVKVHGKHL